MLPGETIRSGAPATCEDCGTRLVPLYFGVLPVTTLKLSANVARTHANLPISLPRAAAEAALPAYLLADGDPPEARDSAFVPSPFQVYENEEAMARALGTSEE